MLIRMDMDSGHFSASDSYRHLEEESKEMAFTMDKLEMVSHNEGSATAEFKITQVAKL